MREDSPRPSPPIEAVLANAPDREVGSVCPYCGVGCQITYRIREDRIVAVDGRNDEIFPTQLRHGFRYATRFIPIDDPLRIAGFHGAETAAARANVAQNHDGRRSSPPTLGDVWAHRFLANGVEVEIFHAVAHARAPCARRNPHREPVGLLDPIDPDTSLAASSASEHNSTLKCAASTRSSARCAVMNET